MDKVLIIFNPCSGKRKSKKHLADIVDLFCKSGYICTVHATQCQGDATTLVRETAANYDRIVCVGGDGTLNEALAGLVSAGSNIPIGYIPTGSTNDFAHSLGIPTKIKKSTQLTLEGTPHTFDIGKFNDRYFSYVASFGAFTRTSYSTSQSIKNALGHTAYILSGIKELGNIKPIYMKFNIDGEEEFEGEYIFGAISNSTSLGGILTLDPNIVDMNDGLFELLLVKAPKNILDLNECIAALTSKKYNSRMLIFKTASCIKVIAPENVDWSLDGEYQQGTENILIKNIPNAFRLLKNS